MSVEIGREYFVVREFVGMRTITNARTKKTREREEWRDRQKFHFSYPQRPAPGKDREKWETLRDAVAAEAKAKAEAFITGREGRWKVAGPQADMYF